MINNINNAASVSCDWSLALEIERSERRSITAAPELFCRCNPAAVENRTREQFLALFQHSRTESFEHAGETWEVFTAGGETMVAWWKPASSQGYIAPELQ